MAGNDIDKIFSKSNHDNIVRFSPIFKLLKVTLLNGSVQIFSATGLQQKIMCLLKNMVKYMNSCHQPELCVDMKFLYFLSAVLHLVAGSLPIVQKEISRENSIYLLRKLPEKYQLACIQNTYISESIHPVVNKLKTRYASVSDLKMKLMLICKDQWISSNPIVPDYRRKR